MLATPFLYGQEKSRQEVAMLIALMMGRAGMLEGTGGSSHQEWAECLPLPSALAGIHVLFIARVWEAEDIPAAHNSIQTGVKAAGR